MKKYILVRINEDHAGNNTPWKYLQKFILDGGPYPEKSWTRNIENAIWFTNREHAVMIERLLAVNTPYPIRIEEHEGLHHI